MENGSLRIDRWWHWTHSVRSSGVWLRVWNATEAQFLASSKLREMARQQAVFTPCISYRISETTKGLWKTNKTQTLQLLTTSRTATVDQIRNALRNDASNLSEEEQSDINPLQNLVLSKAYRPVAAKILQQLDLESFLACRRMTM